MFFGCPMCHVEAAVGAAAYHYSVSLHQRSSQNLDRAISAFASESTEDILKKDLFDDLAAYMQRAC